MNSPFSSEVRPGPVTIASTGAVRRPLGPAMTQVARAAISAGTLSAAGEALHKLPASEARPWTCCEPIRSAPSTIPGQACSSAALPLSMTPGVAAPITNLSVSSRTPIRPGMRFKSTIVSGRIRPERNCTKRSVPPDSGLAKPALAVSARTASSTVVGAVKLTLGMSAPGCRGRRDEAPAGRNSLARHGPVRRPPQAARILDYTMTEGGVKRYVPMPSGDGRSAPRHDPGTRINPLRPRSPLTPASAPPRGGERSGPGEQWRGIALLTPHQCADHRQIGEVEQDAGGKRDRVKTDIVVDRPRHPPAKGHARAAAQQQARHPPRRLAGRKQFADRQHIGRDDAAKAETEGDRDDKQPGFVLGQQKPDHRRRLAGRTGEDRAQAAIAIGDPAP